MAYFAIERNGQSITDVVITGNDGNIMFKDIMEMSYDEMKTYDGLEEFIACVMDVTNQHFNNGDEQTCVTLVDDEGVFIWGIIIGPGDNEGDLRYVLIDWRKDEKRYRYSK